MNNLKALLFTSGYRYTKNNGINVGDVSQFENAVLLLREKVPGVKITAVAHSLSNACVADDVPLSRALSEYIWGSASKSVFNLASIIVRTLLLLLNASRIGNAKDAIFLSKKGQQVLDEFRNTDFLFYAGAGALNRRYMWGPGYIWLLGMFLAKRLHIPYILLGQQIGPLDTFISKLVFRPALEGASFIGVRDHSSLELVKELGVDEKKLRYTGDEGFYLPPCDTDKVDLYLNEQGISADFIAAQFRLDMNSPFHDHITDFARLYSDISKKLGKPLVFVPFSYANNRDDRETHRLITQYVDTPYFLLDYGGNAQFTKALLSKASLAIGVANHFCAFAASVGVPTVGIHATPYMSQKLDGLMRGRDYVLSIEMTEPFDSTRLSHAIVEHAKKYSGLPRIDYYNQRPAGYDLWLEAVQH